MKVTELFENRFGTELDGWYVVDKSTDAVVAGPFASKDEAQKKTMRPPMFANHHRYKIVAFGSALKEENSAYMWDIEGGSGKGKKFGSKDATVDDHLSAMKYHSSEYKKAMQEKRDADARHHGMKYHKHKDQIAALGSVGEIFKEDLGKPVEIQIEKGLSKEEAMKKAPYKKSYGDCRGFSYNKKTGIATWV